MKEFVSAVEDATTEDEREAKVLALIEMGKTREEAEAEADEDPYVEFKLDDRVMRAYHPLDGQLAFMLASLGRGQTDDTRFAAIINIMLECLRGADKDYLEQRLLTGDRKRALKIKQVESIFEYLVEEWFARPTQ